jgi:hypothetical protein
MKNPSVMEGFFFNLLLFLLELNLTVLNGRQDGIALFKPAFQHLIGEGVLQETLDCPA